MLFNDDGEYYIVKFNDGSFYKGNGIVFSCERTTINLKEAQRYSWEWQIPKDIYLQQFLYGKDLICEYVKVKVTTTVEIVND